MWENRDLTPWHCDGKPAQDTVTVKIAVYLDEQDKDSGSLNVIPGSHHPEFSASLFQSCGYWENGNRPRLHFDPDKIPGAISVDTKPRDIILWNNHLWHSAFKRKDGVPRRTLFVTYMPDPGNDLLKTLELRDAVKQHLQHIQQLIGDWPYLYSEQMIRNTSPARNKMIARMDELGVENVRE
jgi:ectoine hydroxylase-related dioxygenase (phytanoyl-CoA dioxygenase family)